MSTAFVCAMQFVLCSPWFHTIPFFDKVKFFVNTILFLKPPPANALSILIQRKKKVREFPVPSRDVTTKLSLGGNNDVITELFLPRGSLVSDIPAVDGKLVNLFLRCTL